MAIKIQTKTAKDGGEYKIITDDGKPTWIKQKIVQLGKDMLKVQSSKGTEYWVTKSDKVQTMKPKIKDTAIIGTFPTGWLVTDIIPYKKPKKEDENKEELQKQIKEFETLGGGY